MSLLKLTYLMQDDGLGNASADDDMGTNNITYERKYDAALFLMTMDSGGWGSDTWTHHCRLGCCKNKRETFLKLWLAIQAAYDWGRADVLVGTRWFTHICCCWTCTSM
jgi:hypothetical protein